MNLAGSAVLLMSEIVPPITGTSMSDLALLLCGGSDTMGTAKIALDQLASSIQTFADKAVDFLVNPVSGETLAFGPFCARVVLENSCAALVGRLDSFRMLYLSEFQAQPEYEHGKRAKSAFSWSGDVMPDEKAAAHLWSLDNDLPKISRALFSKHFDHIYWKTAASAMIDFVAAQPNAPAWGDLLAIDPDTFIGETRGRSAQLYSTLSKGVHWEFFTSTLLFDEMTVKSAIRDTLVLVARLGLISHFVPTAYANIEASEAAARYAAFMGHIS